MFDSAGIPQQMCCTEGCQAGQVALHFCHTARSPALQRTTSKAATETEVFKTVEGWVEPVDEAEAEVCYSSLDPVPQAYVQTAVRLLSSHMRYVADF